MVEIVFEEVVLREVGYVGGLDMGDVGRSEHTDVHWAKCWLERITTSICPRSRA